jgi:hypothetical protein
MNSVSIEWYDICNILNYFILFNLIKIKIFKNL